MSLQLQILVWVCNTNSHVSTIQTHKLCKSAIQTDRFYELALRTNRPVKLIWNAEALCESIVQTFMLYVSKMQIWYCMTLKYWNVEWVSNTNGQDVWAHNNHRHVVMVCNTNRQAVWVYIIQTGAMSLQYKQPCMSSQQKQTCCPWLTNGSLYETSIQTHICNESTRQANNTNRHILLVNNKTVCVSLRYKLSAVWIHHINRGCVSLNKNICVEWLFDINRRLY